MLPPATVPCWWESVCGAEIVTFRLEDMAQTPAATTTHRLLNDLGEKTLGQSLWLIGETHGFELTTLACRPSTELSQ